jgi:hypothetical protein
MIFVASISLDFQKDVDVSRLDIDATKIMFPYYYVLYTTPLDAIWELYQQFFFHFIITSLFSLNKFHPILHQFRPFYIIFIITSRYYFSSNFIHIFVFWLFVL